LLWNPGVLKVDRLELRNKRGYCSLRIPESVAISVHKRDVGLGTVAVNADRCVKILIAYTISPLREPVR